MRIAFCEDASVRKNCTTTVEINVAATQEDGNKSTSRSSYTTPGYILKGLNPITEKLAQPCSLLLFS